MKRRILHLGLGAFHRAHQAVYQQALLDAGEAGWELWSGNLRADPTGAEKALLAQGDYTLETIGAAGVHRYQRIASIARVIPHEAGLQALVEAAADPATRIISCTVTEAGYSVGTPDLNAETIYAFLCRALRQRMEQGAGPVTLLCCDNLRHNGQVLRIGLLQFVMSLLGDAPLQAWIEQHCSFPCTMVDRITPRPGEAVRDRVLLALGQFDKAALMAEDWLQWVIEDRFVAGRPAWETVGVQMVASAAEVTAFEEAKIRILNASHSAMAWAGALRGYRFIHECARDPAIRKIAFDYVTDDVIPLLRGGPIDLPAYRDAVLARFGNEALADTVERVLADSAAKVREFILPTLRERLQRGESIASVAALPALYAAWRGETVQAVCNNAALFEDLAGDARLLAAVSASRR